MNLLTGTEVQCWKDGLSLGVRELGNLAVAFSYYRMIPCSKGVLELTFEKFQLQAHDNDLKLEDVADVFASMPVGKRLDAIPSGFVEEMMQLAIEKSYEARMEDVRDILFAVFQMDLSDDRLCQELLNTYKPLFDKYCIRRACLQNGAHTDSF